MSTQTVSGNYALVKEIFHAALDLKESERCEMLDRACGEDRGLRREVESLLAAHREADDFLNHVSALEAVQSSISNPKNEKYLGQTIGKYRIERELGSGGMGAVFLATREDFHQQVALKLIKSGFKSDAVLRRFVIERQILASLEHPNIARLIDGGTTADDTPYLVMEYVAGIPVDEFCAKKNLSVSERIELFRKICAAVQYAHQNLIVHRDLKPSNILVTEEGEPKLLDFGIAKLFYSDSGIEDAAETTTNFRALTPEYASPEQLRGEKLTTATDVYSLGVILYELLTGNRPFQTGGKNLAEVLRLVCETQPARPSSVVNKPRVTNLQSSNSNGAETDKIDRKANSKSGIRNFKYLKGDLDNIVLKSLKKEPERRYSTVQQLSEDLRRHLVGLPVTAQPDTLIYRFEKFVKRNRAPVVISALLVLALLAGIGATLWQAREARRERELAERRFENIRKLSNSFVLEIHAAIENLPGSQPARQILLKQAVEQLDALAAESGNNPALKDELAKAYYKFAAIPTQTLAEKVKNYEKAITIYQELLAEDAANDHYHAQIAVGFTKLGDLAKVHGDVIKALRYHQKAISILEPLVEKDPASQPLRSNLIGAYYQTAVIFIIMGDTDNSLKLSRKTLNLAQQQLDLNATPENFNMTLVAQSLNGTNLTYSGDYESAFIEYNAVREKCERLQAVYPNDTRFTRNMWGVNRRLAIVLKQKGEFDAALEHVRTALSYIEELLNQSPDDFGHGRSVAITHLLFGQILVQRGQVEQSFLHFRRALELQERNIAIDPELVETKIDLARTYSNFGNALILNGRNEEGSSYLQKSLKFYEELSAKDTLNAELKRDFAEATGWIGAAMAKDKKQAMDARLFLQKSLDLWNEMQTKGILSRADFEQPGKIAQIINQFSN